MDYIIGVDGGGTKTEATAYNLGDEQIATYVAGPGNPAVNFEEAITNITQAISQCMQRINNHGMRGECKGIFLGIAGIEVGINIQRLELVIGEAFKCPVVGVHDSELAHAAIFQGKDGIITIAGTGSVSYGRFKGKTDKTGGWGQVLGDEGSGYWISLEALKRMTVEQDTDLLMSSLSLKIMTYLNVISVDGMKEFVHSAGKYEIANVAKVVVECAQAGDSYAMDILDRAGFELALMTERLYKKLEIEGPLTIGLSGGILRNNERVRRQLCTCLERELGAIQILSEDSPTKGACYLYKQWQEKLRGTMK
jgi:N-acetylglucosamine kinase-like BadF-type ATPase